MKIVIANLANICKKHKHVYPTLPTHTATFWFEVIGVVHAMSSSIQGETYIKKKTLSWSAWSIPKVHISALMNLQTTQLLSARWQKMAFMNNTN